VAVVLVPIQEGGVLAIRRAIDPQRGKLALPGGFVDFGESWQQAACREVFEETSLELSPSELRLLKVVTVDKGLMLFFCVAKPRPRASLQWGFVSSEVEQLVCLDGPVELAFPSHSEALEDYFAHRDERAWL